MNFFSKLTIILAILILNACSKNDKEISLIKEINQEDEMIQAYKEGVKALEENDTFFAAKKFLEAELFEEAKTMYEWAIKNGWKDKNIWTKLAIVNSRLGFESDHYSLGIKTDRDLPTLEEAEDLINRSDLSGAEKILNTIVRSNPNSIDALNDLAVVKIMQNNLEEALTHLSSVLTLDPSNEIAIENLNYLEKEVNSL